ncbi:MAG: ABC transporter ATP-binding protein [Clostridia bacterium]|nr:ABC transporter ATP-binding protein [Clostridia bacterium]
MENKKSNLDILVKAENLSLAFKAPQLKVDTLKERVVNLLKGKVKSTRFQVLNDVSFEIKKGENLGVIGHNGAGKSTLLRLVAGIYAPTSGKITTHGSCMLLNLGAGFDMEANAIENIFLNGAILGFTRKQMKERLNSIIEFAELQEFVHMPLKNYSSGMISRLGFAIAIDVDPDLLLVDEILSVGDTNFQKKCQAKIQELKQRGVSLMFVSHSIPQVRLLCEKTLWIENSKVMAYGDTKEVCDKYMTYCANLQKEQQKQLEAQAKQ